MFFVSDRYTRVFQIFDKRKPDSKYVNMSVSTSEKNQDGEYENSRWYARAVGHAFQQVEKGEVSAGQDYATRGKLTNVRYKDDDGNWHDNYLYTIFDFGPKGQDAGSNSSLSKSGAKPATKKPAAKPAAKKAAPAEDDGDLPW